MNDRTTTDLYRYFDAEGRLLYVGISFSAVARASQHRAEKSWWADVANMTVERHRTRAAAIDAEVRAIRSEAPLHNVIHNSETTRRYGPKLQHRVTVSAKKFNPWACMYCGRPCGKAIDEAYIQVDSLDWWWVLCADCDDNPSPTYWIDGSRIADCESIERWTKHLAEKNWFNWESWYTLIEGHCNVLAAKEHAYAAIEQYRESRSK